MPIYFEHDLVPFETSSLPSGPWLVLAPHPDDETFGMGGAILLAKEKNIPVEVVFVTSGEKAGDPFEREKEALQAAEVLGVQGVHFLHLPDRRVFKNLNILIFELKKFFKQKFKAIFAPSLQEFHPDHRAVGLAAAAVAPFFRELWLYEVARQGEVNRLLDISSVFQAKKKAMGCYKSQLYQNRYLEIVEALNIARTYTLSGVTHAEGFFATKGGILIRRYARWLQKYFLF